MQPLTHSGHATPIEAPVSEPHFWRVTYADLVTLWGEHGALHMLRAMERAYGQQALTSHIERPGPCFEPGQTASGL